MQSSVAHSDATTPAPVAAGREITFALAEITNRGTGAECVTPGKEGARSGIAAWRDGVTGGVKRTVDSGCSFGPFSEGMRLRGEGNTCYASGGFASSARKFADGVKEAQVSAKDAHLQHIFLTNRASANLSLGNYALAMTDAQKAIELRPHYARAHVRKALAFLAMHRAEDATHCIYHCIELCTLDDDERLLATCILHRSCPVPDTIPECIQLLRDLRMKLMPQYAVSVLYNLFALLAKDNYDSQTAEIFVKREDYRDISLPSSDEAAPTPTSGMANAITKSHLEDYFRTGAFASVSSDTSQCVNACSDGRGLSSLKGRLFIFARNDGPAALSLWEQIPDRPVRLLVDAIGGMILKRDNLDDLEEVDLDATYVGNRGLMALLDVVSAAPNFRKVSFAEQNIYNSDLSPDSIKGNEVVDRVVEVCESHPCITALDLSSNPLSNFAGRKLLGLVNKNPKIVNIQLEDTRIDTDLVRHIAKQCEKNLEATWEKHNNDDPFEEKAFADEGEEGFGHVKYAPPKAKVPDLGGFGGGVRKKTVLGAPTNAETAKAFKPPFYPKTAEDENLLWDLLKEIVLFSYFDRDTLKLLVGAMVQRKMKKGEKPLQEGEHGDKLYIIASGVCSVSKKGVHVASKAEKSVFGELELMYDTPCVATVEVESEDCVTWTLDRVTYTNIVIQSNVRRRSEYEGYLANVGFLSTLSPYETMQLADALSTDEWLAGDYIIRHGDPGEWMFLVISGTCEVIGRDSSGNPSLVCEFQAGGHFGELEFLNNHTCVADVRAKTDVRTARINRKHFELCLGPVIYVLKRNTSDPKYEYYKKQLELATIEDGKAF
ncbi:cAMP-dependent protein kinase regulatory subunit [Diplonema papillatum]|nr:cAMP-dependent protein kinase regulatory subunit [Diplonema papillatum]